MLLLTAENGFALAAALLYGAALWPLLRSLTSGGDWSTVPGISRNLTAVAVLLHLLALHGQIVRPGGLIIGLSHAASLFLWQCALFVWLMSYRRPLGYLYTALMPATAMAALASIYFGGRPENTTHMSWTVALHVALSMLAYGLLTLAAVQGASLALQDRLLRRHDASHWLKQLPPLQSMEQTLFQFMAAGFFMLSLALLSGLIFVEDLFAQHLVHKTALSLFAWAIFGTLLWGRWRFGWRGRTAIRWTLGGYLALLLAYFGSKWVLEVLLGTGWQ